MNIVPKISTSRWILKFLATVFVVINAAAISSFGQNAQAARLPDLSVSSGPKDAEIKLILFYDLQCPTCATFHEKIDRIKKRFGKDVYISIRQFPLSIPAHDKAFMAARFVLAAELQGKGWQMIDSILVNQRKWTASVSARNLMVRYAKRLGLDMQRFMFDIDSSRVEFSVVRDIEFAESLDINETPSVILNGKRISFAEADRIEKTIEDLLKKRK